MPSSPPERTRPLSPNIQIYRPQLTSVLSIANRISGVVLSISAVGLVVWLIAAATGPQAYAAVQSALASTIGQIVLFGATFAFFLHLCGGIRHLAWDAGYGFDLRCDLCLGMGRGGGERRAHRGSLDRRSVYGGVEPMARNACARRSVAPLAWLGERWCRTLVEERVTAVALVPLTLWFVASIIAHRGSDYTAFIAWLKTPLATLMMVLF